MKKLILFLVTIVFLTFLPNQVISQDWMETKSVWNSLRHQVSGNGNISLSGDLIQIQDDVTVDFFVPVKTTKGIISIWGYIESISGSGDNIIFAVSPHRGDGFQQNPHFTPIYINFDTVSVNSGEFGQFEIYPMSSEILRAKFSSYLNFRVITTSTAIRKMYIKIEWLQN